MRDDRGMITSFVVVLSIGFIFVAGMVYDGGQRVTTYMRASDLASNAARAAAQEADLGSLYDADAATQLDPGRAEAAAEDFLATAGYSGALDDITVTGDQVTVFVTLQQTSVILEWLGTVDISAHASATAVRGVNEGTTGGP